MMRALFVVLLLANGVLYGIGAGWFGVPPAERGRDPARLKTERHVERIEVVPLAR